MNVYDDIARQAEIVINALQNGQFKEAVMIISSHDHPEALMAETMMALDAMDAIKTFGPILKTEFVSRKKPG